MKTNSRTLQLTNWIIGLLFVTIGILNIFLIHPVPGILYLVLSLIYLPPIYESLQIKLGFSLNFMFKMVMAFMIIWGTLGVGDLMEIFEAWMLGS